MGVNSETKRIVINFWCRKCRIDWKVIAKKYWLNTVFGEVWAAKCDECGKLMVRLINDAPNDPYFRLSFKVKAERIKYANDVLQPNDPNFDILYPQHKRERLAREEKQQREAWEKSHER